MSLSRTIRLCSTRWMSIHNFMTEEERKAVVYMDDKETALISLLNK